MKSVVILLVCSLAVAGCNKNKLDLGPQGPLNSNMDDIQPLDGAGMLRMAQTLEQTGDLTSAAQFYMDALGYDNQIIEAHLGLARVFMAGGDQARATIYYQNVLTLDPGNLEAAMGAASNLIMQERVIDAKKVLETYLANGPATPALLNYLGVTLDLGTDHDGAASAYRQGLAMITPGDSLYVILMNNLALSLSLAGSYSEAIMLLNPHIGDMRLGHEGISSAQSSFRQNLALVYALSNNAESAVEVARSALGDEMATFNRSFYEMIPNLNSYEQARAVFLGKLPDSNG